METVVCNSAPAVLFYSAGNLDGVYILEIVDGKITNFYAVRNPDKLAATASARAISRI
jgi:RNA polymerase sigma-70 factor (ECF subfamily)